MTRTGDSMTLTDVVMKLANIDVDTFDTMVRAGKVGLVGYVFGLKPRELTKMVTREIQRRTVWGGNAKLNLDEQES